MVVIKDVDIAKAQKADVRKGWIRINQKLRGPEIKNNGIYKITIAHSKPVYRIIKGNDKIRRGERVVLMDYETQNKLGVKPGDTVDVKLTRNILYWHFYLWNHPSEGIRVTYISAFVAIVITLLITLIFQIK